MFDTTKIYQTRFRKCELAKALDNKFNTHLVSSSGRIQSEALFTYFMSIESLKEELKWTSKEYKAWRGYIDPASAKIICKHLDLCVDDFD